VIGDKSGDCRARVEDAPDEGLNAEGLQKLKVIVASVSNPGVHANVAPLKHKPVTRYSTHSKWTENLTKADILMLQKTEDSLDDSDPGTEQPKISVGADTSTFTHTTALCKPKCIAKILRHIKIGSDLSTAEWITVKET
jgi:hypothetical protein